MKWSGFCLAAAIVAAAAPAAIAQIPPLGGGPPNLSGGLPSLGGGGAFGSVSGFPGSVRSRSAGIVTHSLPPMPTRGRRAVRPPAAPVPSRGAEKKWKIRFGRPEPVHEHHRFPHRRFWRPIHGVYFPVFGYSYTNYVVEVDADRLERSNARHVITVPSSREPEEPTRAKIYEVRPKGEEGEVDLEEVKPSRGEPEAAAAELTLIALREGVIYPAADYWLEGDMIRFKTLDEKDYALPLAELDLELSARLNRQRGVAFILEVR